MRRFFALFIFSIAAIILSTAASSAAPPADPEGGAAATAVIYVYWTEVDAGTIMRGAADGSGSPQTCVTGQKDPRGLVIAADLNRMYWVERGAGRLRRADLNCPAGNIQTIGPTLVNPDRIALDLVGGKIYWTENKVDTVISNRIRRADLDGNNPETILDNSDVNEPVGLVIDRANNRLYWTDLGTDSIRSATLDGGNPQLVRQLADDVNPLEIALDAANNRLFLASGAKGAIYTVPLGTGSPAIWRSLGAPRSLVLDLPGNMIYWGDQGTHEIRRDTLNATNNQLLFNAGDGVDQPLGVALLYGEAVDCYSLTRSHTGSGNNPAAAPGSSTGCATGQYTAGQLINLTATPAAGWRVAGWSGTNNDASTSTTNTVTMPNADHTVSVTYVPTCYTLTRNHSGSGNNPTAAPAFSSGCGTGQYTANTAITLTADPADGWYVAGWSGTDNDSSPSTTNTVTMPNGNHTVSVIYESVLPPCYTLTRAHSGSGNNPVANPPFTSGCGTGQYTANTVITLTADPADGWRVAGWSGTNNDSSPSTTNTVNMPAGAHTVNVTYTEIINPGNFVFFVPAVLHIPPACFAGPNEQEGNDTPAQANGPLCTAGSYTGLPDDSLDYFMFETDVSGRVAVTITNHRGGGVQLQLYYGSVGGDPIDEDTNQLDGLDVAVASGPAGRYYIQIYTERPTAEMVSYTMQVQFP